MNPTQVTTLVDRGAELRERIKLLQKELKSLEDMLRTIGLSAPQEDLKDQDREGRRWLAKGTRLIVPVIFTADKLIGSFTDGSPSHVKIEGAAAGQLKSFFRSVKTWENRYDNGKFFRGQAQEILGNHAPGFISACLARDKDGLPKSDIKIEWDAAEPVGAMTNDE